MIDRIVFIGSKRLGLDALSVIHRMSTGKLCAVVTVNDSSDERSVLHEFKKFSQATGVKLHVLEKPSELEDVIRKESPGLCFVVGWYWLIKAHVLRMVEGGFLGVHASLLPQYRGSSPLVWTILNGENGGGASMFHFDEGMDTGDIVDQRRFSIGQDEGIGEVLTKVRSATLDMIHRNFLALLTGNAPRFPQKHEFASYCAQRRPEDGRIDWGQTEARIHNAIRAQSHPYPGAFCYMGNGDKLFIWRSSVYSYPYHGRPGLVVRVSDGSAIVICGKGAVVLSRIQVEGMEEMSPEQVLKHGMQLS